VCATQTWRLSFTKVSVLHVYVHACEAHFNVTTAEDTIGIGLTCSMEGFYVLNRVHMLKGGRLVGCSRQDFTDCSGIHPT
jgi:hypothetical protein